MFVPADEIQLQWNEPLFFRFRILGGQGLLLRGVAFLVFCALFASALAFEPPSAAGSRSVVGVVALVVLASTVLTVLGTAPSIQRRVTLTRDGISWANLYPASLILFFLSSGALSRREMNRVLLRRPKEAGNHFAYGLLVVELKYASPTLFAVPKDLALEKVARVLHDNGVPVELAGWSPGPDSESAAAGKPT